MHSLQFFSVVVILTSVEILRLGGGAKERG